MLRKVSESPTRPRPDAGGAKSAATAPPTFDVMDLYRGAVATGEAPAAADAPPLDEKLRQAYFWIVNHAIISPFYDLEYNDRPPFAVTLGDRKGKVVLPSDQSYSSFVLLPLLTFAVRRKCLLVGGPGRGKTASAILMGILAGYSPKDVKRAIQKGQPQMTIADLLGNPMPADLVSAQRMEDIRIAWRQWLGQRVKIIDEYNRIPTRTQSALLTVMADNYAEILNQTYECPESAWYLTANDDAGGGTYQVIEALKDRIDVVVHALHFNTRFLGELLARLESRVNPESLVPPEIIFTEAEWDRMYGEILAVALPEPLRRRLEFFASHFEFAESASTQLEYKTKDTVKLAGLDLKTLAAKESGKDKAKDLGQQTQCGLSVRALMTALVFVKAMAYFRGAREVALEDLRQMLPFVLHDKLAQNGDAAFFEAEPNEVFRADRIGWLRQLFDQSCAEYERLGLDREDPVRAMLATFGEGLDGLPSATVRGRLADIERVLRGWSDARKFYGHMLDDVIALKYLHQRYTNYLHWVEWKGAT
jgi:MoxR-like ATPase